MSHVFDDIHPTIFPALSRATSTPLVPKITRIPLYPRSIFVPVHLTQRHHVGWGAAVEISLCAHGQLVLRATVAGHVAVAVALLTLTSISPDPEVAALLGHLRELAIVEVFQGRRVDS